MDPRLRVFVSSRMAELEEERRLVKEALDELEVDAWVFEEDAGARPESSRETFLEEVESADLYLGIFWRGYGPHTREESDRALARKKDRLVYEKRADVDGREPELQEFLDELNSVETGVTIKRFETAEELRGFVKEDVAAWQTRVVRQRREVAETVAVLEQRLVGSEEERSFLKDQVRALTEAVAALASQKGQADAPSNLDKALEELAAGRTETAKGLFSAASVESSKEAAQAERHLGALAFLDDTQEALAAYRRATELDPENPDGWNQLGHLLARTGNLLEAENAYRRVLEHGVSERSSAWEATGLGNLGNVCQANGDLDRAARMYERALELDNELGNKEGMANAYGNLGNIYRARRDPERAAGMYKRALALDAEIDQKEGMAAAYSNLGNLQYDQGKLDRALELYEKALDLLGELGNKQGMAQLCRNLGIMLAQAGALGTARGFLTTAHDLHVDTGMTHKVEEIECWLAELDEES